MILAKLRLKMSRNLPNTKIRFARPSGTVDQSSTSDSSSAGASRVSDRAVLSAISGAIGAPGRTVRLLPCPKTYLSVGPGQGALARTPTGMEEEPRARALRSVFSHLPLVKLDRV